jgi:uncharacterized protein DUF3489
MQGPIHAPGRLKSNTKKESANSIALKPKDNQALPRPWPAPGQGRYHHCGDFEGHRMQPHSVRGFLAGTVKKKLGLTLESEKTKSCRIYRIVRAKTSAPSASASGTAEQGDA